MMSVLRKTNPSRRLLRFAFGLFGVALLTACQGEMKQSPAEELAKFDKVDASGVSQVGNIQPASIKFGPYKVQRGDILQVYMPEVMSALKLSDLDIDVPNTRAGSLISRVDDEGFIVLPHVSKIKVADKTLSAVDTAVRAAYFPAMLKTSPTVVSTVDQHTTRKIVVTGSVADPGVFDLQLDEMNLYAALARAGGLRHEGLGSVRIRRFASEAAEAREDKQELFVLPLMGSNMPYINLELRNGDVVEVASDQVQQYAAIGLVNAPGARPYPPGRSFTLLQAIAAAGGLKSVADPHYVTVYRQNQAGTLSFVRYKVDREGLEAMGHARIKPGDVLIAEQTLRTKINELIPELIRSARDFGVGLGSAAATQQILRNNSN